MTQCLFDVVFVVTKVTLGPKPCVNMLLKFTVTCFRSNVSGGVFHVCVTTVVKLFVQYLVAICLFNNRIIWSNFGINFTGKNIFHKGKI